MALLVNFEGLYTEPQKLWFYVDSTWKEVINVFESPIQREIALVDSARISQDKTVLSLNTKIEALQASLDGSDPSILLVTDEVEKAKIQEEIKIVQLQWEIAKVEQVSITKTLFEQKAQTEYKKLVLEGEKAIQKISNIVDVVDDWGIIKLEPQDILDERVELVIQHGLSTEERIFNYGNVYYRLYRLNQIADEDNLTLLFDNYKRRMNKTAHTNGTIATNYILNLLSVKETFQEVSVYVSSGAVRIENFLSSLQDQEKYILDNMEKVKSNINELKFIAETSDLISFSDSGLILTNSTIDTQKVELGKILLESQDTESFEELISTEVISKIETGEIERISFPNYEAFTANTEAVAEKLEAIISFKEQNDLMLADVETGKISFEDTTVLTERTAATSDAQALFWNKPLGTSSIAVAGDTVTFIEGYTSSGTYKFKTNELVELDTEVINIIQTLLANTQTGNIGITLGNQFIKIIQVVDNTTVLFEMMPNTSTNTPYIINAEESTTKEIINKVSVNENIQPHEALPFVKEANTFKTTSNLHLSVLHPIINSLAYSTTYNVDIDEMTHIDSVVFDRSFTVYNIATVNDTFGFNCVSVPNEKYTRNDNIINMVDSINDTFGFNCVSVPNEKYTRNDNIINMVDSINDTFGFNCVSVPNEKYTRNDNIINMVDSINSDFGFNIHKENLIDNPLKNAYQQKIETIITDTDGMVIIEMDELSEIKNYIPLTVFASKTRKNMVVTKPDTFLLSSQTGVFIHEVLDDYINTVHVDQPKIITATKTVGRMISNDNINKLFIENPKIITATKTVGSILVSDNINKSFIENPKIITNTKTTGTLITGDPLNRVLSGTKAIQLNPEVNITYLNQ